MPSPILPDGRMLPLPIPSRHDRHTLGDLHCGEVELGSLLADLSKGRHSPATTVHLDPDLDRTPQLRLPGWRPALGQTGAAQSHLCAQGVAPGDVFLFFGWFRQAERAGGRWRYARNARDMHVIFGWLEIAEILPIVEQREDCLARHPWIADHPHVASPAHYTDRRNSLYIAPKRSACVTGRSGGGLFSRFSSGLQLTAHGESRSVWSLPKWFLPAKDQPALSYHANPSRWSDHGDHCRLKSVAKGQEFVMHIDGREDAQEWVRRLVVEHA